MIIKRDTYLKALISRKQNGMVKVVTGVRRCGKSFLLNELFYAHLRESGISEDHIIRFGFDSADDLMLIGESLLEITREKRKVNPEKFVRYINSIITDRNDYYLLLDEIQLLDQFEMVLNGYLRKPNIDIYVTGSNAKPLSKDVITEFAGRGDEIHMYPLSFSEFMSAYDGDRYSGLREYMLYGGIPLVVLRKDEKEKSALLRNLFTEIYIRDIKERNSIRDTESLEDILNILSSSIGSLTNPEKLRNTFRSVKKSDIANATIKKYLDGLEDAFLVEAARRYDIKGRAYIGSPLKYYFTDLGLRNIRINFRQNEETHSLENVIYNELKIRGCNVDVGVVPCAERNGKGNVSKKQLEVDFVCNQGLKTYYIQSAYSLPDAEKRTQEIRPFLKINDSFKKIIITNDFVNPLYDNDGILTMNVFDFLLSSDSLDRY